MTVAPKPWRRRTFLTLLHFSRELRLGKPVMKQFFARSISRASYDSASQ
jgi:hypothetical protein